MAKYGKKASEKVERAMHEMKRGQLKSGRSGKKVTSRKQAIAIGLSEAREEGGKVPSPKSMSAGKTKKSAKGSKKRDTHVSTGSHQSKTKTAGTRKKRNKG